MAAPATTVLLFGDSIIAGYGLPATETISVKMEKLWHEEGKAITVMNGGISGDTTSGGRSRIEWTLNRYHPDIIVIALGGNDMLRGISPEITRQNLDAIVSVSKSHHIKIVLTAVSAPMNLGERYVKEFNGIYTTLANKYDIPLYPFLLKDIYRKPGMMQLDGLHPTIQGAEVIAKALVKHMNHDFF
ncbi:MAG: arylesterase [Alphaproteobacteria bacterium]|nr:arylesterase [Alphaproteobacteria bacterium]